MAYSPTSSASDCFDLDSLRHDSMDFFDDHGSPLSSHIDNEETTSTEVTEAGDDNKTTEEVKKEEGSEKKPAKKRKSWGQELPTPKTNLPPR